MIKMNDIYIPTSYYEKIFTLFFEAFEIISLQEDYKFIKHLSDKQIECVLMSLTQILTLKSNKKQKPVLPSVDYIIKLMLLGFDAVKDVKEEQFEPINIHLLSV